MLTFPGGSLFVHLFAGSSDGALGIKERKTASSDDAGFLKAEIAAAAGCGCADDDVIHQLELEDSAGLEDSPGESYIGLTRRSLAGWMVVH